MTGRGETMTMEEPGKAKTGRKKKMQLRIGGPEILVGALAVAVVVGAAIRIRRYRSLRDARKRIRHGCSGDRSGGLRTVLQGDEDHPHFYTMDVTAEMVLSRMLEQDSIEHEIQVEKIEENGGHEASDVDHGEWMAKEISDDEDEESAKEEEDYDSAEVEGTANQTEEDEVAGSEAEEGEVAGSEAEEDDYDDDEEEEEEDEGECVVGKCEEGSQGKEDNSMESNAEVVRSEEMKEWQLEIKEMKTSHHGGRIHKTQTYNFLNEMERRVPAKIKLRIWIWTTLMLLLLLLLSLTNQKTYVSFYY